MAASVRFLLFAAVCIFASAAFAELDPPSVAKYLCQQTQSRPKLEYERYFSADFRRTLPEVVLIDVFRGLAIDAGACEKAWVLDPNTSGKAFVVHMETRPGNVIRFDVSLEDRLAGGRIDELLVNDVSFPSVIIRDMRDLQIQLNRLPGEASATIAPLGRAVMHVDGHARHPIGSVFKLYVLGALERAIREGKARWQELLPIREAYKSLPSGVMQTWPAGQRASFFEFARHMIEISDNTATDHLIRFLTREKVEAELGPMGNSFIDDNRPLLLTSEMFKIKHALRPEGRKQYLYMSPDARRVWLETRAPRIPLSSVRYQSQPVHVREIEWFSSTNDMCRALYDLDGRRSFEIRRILSGRTPGVTVGPGSEWRYAGYKGGSEPGVIAAAYFLESHRGERACVALAWHNPIQPVGSWRLRDLARKAIPLAR